MGDFENFQVAIVDYASRILQPVFKEHYEEVAIAIGNQLFELDGLTAVNRKASSAEKIFSRIFTGFTEITKSYEAIKDTEVYLRRFPFRGSSVTKERYLRHHIEAYFHEVYILKERLISYLRVLERLYRKAKHHESVENIVELIEPLVHDVLGGIVEVRGVHVHRSRYSDHQLEKLSTLDLLTRNSEEPLYEEWYGKEFRRVRKEWIDTIRLNQKEIEKLLDLYFLGISKIVFDSYGHLNEVSKQYN
jgi:hypothetical protein